MGRRERKTISSKQCGLLLVAFVAGLLGGAVGGRLSVPTPVFAQAGPARLIEAREFRVVDDRGFARALFMASDKGTSIVLKDEGLNIRASLSISSKGNAELSLADRKGEDRAVVGVTDDGRASLRLTDERGNSTGAIASGFAVTDKDLKAGVEVGLLGGLPRIELNDKSNTPRLRIALTPDPALLFSGRYDKEGLILSHRALQITDAYGRVVWSVP